MVASPVPTFDEHTWRKLLAAALRVVDSLRHNGYGELDFRLGGGTVLMFRFGHRLSKDIDIFTYDAQALGFLSPRLNEVAEREVEGYEEQPNTVKLLLRDGDVDFIVAGPVIPGAVCETLEFEGREIALDATSEILAKKLLYRAESFKARDVFDMAAALALDPQSALEALRATARTRPVLLRRLAAMEGMPHDELVRGIVATASGGVYAAGMVGNLRQAIATLGGT